MANYQADMLFGSKFPVVLPLTFNCGASIRSIIVIALNNTMFSEKKKRLLRHLQ